MTHNLNHAISAYRQAATHMHPLMAVVRLFDEALKRIARAVDDTAAKRIEDAYININRASMILRGLSSNLRFDKGEDVAEALKKTYIANMIALHTAFGKPDAAARYGRIALGLTELRNAWAEAAGMAPVEQKQLDKIAGTGKQSGKSLL